MNQRYLFLIAFACSTVLLMQAWQKESVKPAATASVSSAINTGAGSVPIKTTASVPSVPVLVSPSAFKAESIRVETDLYVAHVNTLGGVLESIAFKQHKGGQGNADVPFELLQSNQKHFHVAQTGLIGQGLPNHTTPYRVSVKELKLQPGQSEVRLLLTPDTPVAGAIIEREWVFKKGSYVIDANYKVSSQSPLPWAVNAYFQIERDDLPPAGQSYFVSSFTGVGMYNPTDHYQKVSFDDIKKNKASFNAHPANGWVGMVEHYFVSAWLLQADAKLGIPEFFTRHVGDNRYVSGLVITQMVQPQQKAVLSLPLYVGPQEQEKIAAIAPGLELTVDYGMFTIVAVPIFKLLKFLHGLLGNWGWAILLMTFLLKCLFYPLNRASAYSMAKTKLLTPRIEHIRTMYKDDPLKTQQEILNLYKQEKVNPVGGCLPILLQIPVFIALYWVLLSAVELRHAPWVGWIQDLSASDPYFILPAIYALSSFIQAKVNPKPTTPSGSDFEATLMQYLPVAFSVMFIFFPAGMLLYWILNNTLTILQQWQVNKSLARKGLR